MWMNFGRHSQLLLAPQKMGFDRCDRLRFRRSWIRWQVVTRPFLQVVLITFSIGLFCPLLQGQGVQFDGEITTLAGKGAVNPYPYSCTSLGDGGPATQACLGFPMAVATDGSGNVFIADALDNRIRRVDAVTQTITTVAGTGAVGICGDGGLATNACLSYPKGLATDKSGNLFIADTGNFRVRRVDAASQIITTVAGNGSNTSCGDGGPATSACVEPVDVAVDQLGNLFIAHADRGLGGGRIRRVDASTQTITTVAGGGYDPEHPFNCPSDPGPATKACLFPMGVTLNGSGNLFIADEGAIREVDSSGTISTITFNGIGFPTRVPLDSSGNVFYADSLKSSIFEVTIGVGSSAVAGNGTHGFCGDGGPDVYACLNGPQGLAIDKSGDLFIADSYNNRIRQVRGNGPALILSTNLINFSNQPVGTVSASQSVTLTNQGGLHRLGLVLRFVALYKSAHFCCRIRTQRDRAISVGFQGILPSVLPSVLDRPAGRTAAGRNPCS
jgi:sugar lactone lactonase YvrE